MLSNEIELVSAIMYPYHTLPNKVCSMNVARGVIIQHYSLGL
jgi:hypothetical protein